MDCYSTPRASISNDFKAVKNHEEQYSTPCPSVNDDLNPAHEDYYSTPRPSVNNDSNVVQNDIDCYSVPHRYVRNTDQNDMECYSTPHRNVRNDSIAVQNDMECYSTQRPSVNNSSSFDQNHEDDYALLCPNANINSISHQNHEEKNNTAPSQTVATTKDEGAIQSQTTYDNLPVYATPIPRVNHNTLINQTTDYDNLNITPTVNEESEESAYVIVSNHANLKKDKVCTYVAM